MVLPSTAGQGFTFSGSMRSSNIWGHGLDERLLFQNAISSVRRDARSKGTRHRGDDGESASTV